MVYQNVFFLPASINVDNNKILSLGLQLETFASNLVKLSVNNNRLVNLDGLEVLCNLLW